MSFICIPICISRPVFILGVKITRSFHIISSIFCYIIFLCMAMKNYTID